MYQKKQTKPLNKLNLLDFATTVCQLYPFASMKAHFCDCMCEQVCSCCLLTWQICIKLQKSHIGIKNGAFTWIFPLKCFTLFPPTHCKNLEHILLPRTDIIQPHFILSFRHKQLSFLSTCERAGSARN